MKICNKKYNFYFVYGHVRFVVIWCMWSAQKIKKIQTTFKIKTSEKLQLWLFLSKNYQICLKNGLSSLFYAENRLQYFTFTQSECEK